MSKIFNGRKLLSLRKKANISQKQLGELTRIGNSSISKLESGKVTSPTTATYMPLAKYFGIEPSELWKEVPEKVKPGSKPVGSVDHNNKVSEIELTITDAIKEAVKTIDGQSIIEDYPDLEGDDSNFLLLVDRFESGDLLLKMNGEFYRAKKL